ncbi:pentatricopeptide repeat-containing protein At3g22690 [Phalaenopsis equestris]|uniref:pentatricopeptide repeat-containing protein At3g22690 n=1 Tax=Phalaenopsis equestris TaxID=78828 RepID=UPI0009E41C7A|nr:pentatricopeptide repeat-containing protein At3g22690 [Phalaenopsis equestris]
MAANSISPSASPSSSQDIPIFFHHTKTVVHHLKSSRSIKEIKQIHCQITKIDLLPFPSSNLISAYCNAATAQSLDYALKTFFLFNEEHESNLFLWNSLIRGFSSAGYVCQAIQLFIQMVDGGIMPDRFTFPPLLSGLTKALAFRGGGSLHGLLLKLGSHGGVQDDIFIQNSLIHFYAEQGRLECAHKVFDSMHERNVVSWTSLIDGYARGDDPRKAVDLFWDMVAEGRIAPNSVSAACAISSCARLQDLESGKRVLAYAAESGMEFSIILVNTVVDMYMKCGAVELAERIFHECADKNIVLWNTMLSNYSHGGMAQKAVALFNEMLISGMKPDRVTVVTAISGSAQLVGEGMAGRRFHGYVLRNGLDVWPDVSNSIIDLYMKCRELDSAFRVFDRVKQKTVESWNRVIHGCIRNSDWTSAWKYFEEMPGRDQVSWNTMIAALVQESQFEEAISLFREMQSSGMRPDRVTMVSVASACGYLGSLDLAKWTCAYIIKKIKVSIDVKLNTALVDMFARCGDSKSSMKVFDRILNKDVSAWTAAIGAMAVEGNGRKAIELFSEMIKDGVEPDSVVFVQALTACSHGGLVEEGYMFFQSMRKDYGFTPHIVHYGCMVDLLGRSGLIDEARELIESMPMEPNDVVWGALLAASCVHHDFEQAEYAAKKVLELAPDRSGIHVLLSNLYASVGRWKEVAAARLSLKDKGIGKIPGSCVIEIEGMIHEFTSSDESHPQMELISEMLQEISHKLSLAGYAPHLDKVLLDVVNEEGKEYLLSRHSEKMAVAFGLISTGRKIPIRVIKNLRICSDCHAFMKLVSATYCREITVRDNNRFHHFVKGKCSCRDFW